MLSDLQAVAPTFDMHPSRCIEIGDKLLFSGCHRLWVDLCVSGTVGKDGELKRLSFKNTLKKTQFLIEGVEQGVQKKMIIREPVLKISWKSGVECQALTAVLCRPGGEGRLDTTELVLSNELGQTVSTLIKGVSRRMASPTHELHYDKKLECFAWKMVFGGTSHISLGITWNMKEDMAQIYYFRGVCCRIYQCMPYSVRYIDNIFRTACGDNKVVDYYPGFIVGYTPVRVDPSQRSKWRVAHFFSTLGFWELILSVDRRADKYTLQLGNDDLGVYREVLNFHIEKHAWGEKIWRKCRGGRELNLDSQLSIFVGCVRGDHVVIKLLDYNMCVDFPLNESNLSQQDARSASRLTDVCVSRGGYAYLLALAHLKNSYWASMQFLLDKGRLMVGLGCRHREQDLYFYKMIDIQSRCAPANAFLHYVLKGSELSVNWGIGEGRELLKQPIRVQYGDDKMTISAFLCDGGFRYYGAVEQTGHREVRVFEHIFRTVGGCAQCIFARRDCLMAKEVIKGIAVLWNLDQDVHQKKRVGETVEKKGLFYINILGSELKMAVCVERGGDHGYPCLQWSMKDLIFRTVCESAIRSVKLLPPTQETPYLAMKIVEKGGAEQIITVRPNATYSGVDFFTKDDQKIAPISEKNIDDFWGKGDYIENFVRPLEVPYLLELSSLGVRHACRFSGVGGMFS